MKKFVAFLAGFFLLCQCLLAQNRTITGKVTDEQGKGVPYASVVLKGTGSGTTADVDGNFSIQAKTGDVLVFSSSGHEVQQSVGADNTLNITLNTSSSLTEVVVTSLGIARQPKELGYSLAKVKATELTQAKVTNLQNGLTGKISGLNIATTNNGVFADTRLTLRGIRSLTGNNQPMLVLDGVPVPLGFLSSINPNDIQDVSILKSSSGTAIYGPDGVNGALVVTTKKGVKGRPLITFSQSMQYEAVSYMPKFQSRFGAGYSPDPLTGYGTFSSIEQQSWGPEYDGSIVQIGQDGPDGEKYMVPYSPIKNNRKDFYDVGRTSQTDISYSTGDFYMSAQNVSINGTMPGDKLNRRTFTLRAERSMGKFKAGFTMRYKNSQYDVTNNNQTVYYGITSAPAHIPLSKFANWRTDYFSSPNGYYSPYLDNAGKTPYFAKDNYRETGSGDDLFGNGELNFTATSWLKLTYRMGLAFASDNSRSTRGAFNYSAFHNTLNDHGTQNVTSAVTSNNNQTRRFSSEIFADMNKKFGRVELGLLLGQSYRESDARFLSVGSNNLGNSTALIVALRKGEPTVGATNTRNRLDRYFGKFSVGYDGWAFMELTGSYDRDSRLVNPFKPISENDIAFFYPGVSTSFLLHEVFPGLKGDVLNYLKLRAAINKTGNVTIRTYGFQDIFNSGTFFPYGDLLGVQASATAFDKKYSPEFVLNKEIGAEMSFLNNRINFEASFYSQNNTDQIIDIQLSKTTGYTSAIRNAADFVNEGMEFDLRLTPLVKIRDVEIDFKVNYTKQRNRISRLIDGVDELGIGNFNYAIVGQPAYVFKLIDYKRDNQGRVIVDAVTGMPSQDPNLRQFGQSSPTDFLGLSLNVNWKGLSFSAVVDYRGGGQIVADQLGGFMDDNGISIRSASNGRRAFVFPNSSYADPASPGKYIENTNVYTQIYGRLFWNSDLNTLVTSNYLADGSFWKVRELAINYEVPVTKLLGSKLSSVVKGVSVGLSGRNLFMWVPKSNVWTDPEFQGGNGNAAFTGNATGRSTAFNAPPTRIFGANIAFRF